MPPFSRSLPRESATAADSSEGVNEGRIFATNESSLRRYVVNDWPGPALSSNYAVKASVLFAYQVFTFVRVVARYRICTVGGGYDVLIVFNGGLIDVFPFVLLDGRRPLVNPICKARNATALLQASPAASAARDNFQCDRLSRYCDRLSRYCDHWKKVDHKRRPAVVVETMFGRRLSGAPTCRDCGHLWGEGHSEPRLQLHSEPRLRLMLRQRSHAC